MPRAASLALSVAIMLLSACAVWNALEWPWKAKLFPLAIGVPLFVLAAAEALWAVFGAPAAAEARDLALPGDLRVRDIALAAGWIGGFLAAIVLLGFPLAVPLFVFAYLVIQGRERRLFSALFSAAVWALFYGLFDRLLHLPFPAGWLLGGYF